MNDEDKRWMVPAGDVPVPTWTPPEDEDADVMIEEARSLLAAWCAIPAGGAIPAAVSDRMMYCTPDFLRLAVKYADEVERLKAYIADDAEKYPVLASEVARLRSEAMPLVETCEALRALLAAEKEKTDRSVPMKSILAARDLFEMGSAEYESIDDILAGKWTVRS